MKTRMQEMDKLAADPKAEETALRQAAEDALEIVHDMVGQMGFTPNVQELAKKSVALSLKAIGSKPELATILGRLKMQEGKFITSHSMMLGEISCALASKLGWNSSTTLLKLTLAAFLHDLPLQSNSLAKVRRLGVGTEAESLPATDVLTVKLHPKRAADLSLEFHQIPLGVDAILLEHHERGDGAGFPRGLLAHQISPLSAIFIVAHDLLDFFLDQKEKIDANFYQVFLNSKAHDYATGVFRKISESLATGKPMMIGEL